MLYPAVGYWNEICFTEITCLVGCADILSYVFGWGGGEWGKFHLALFSSPSVFDT